jgi:hypothetical protein
MSSYPKAIESTWDDVVPGVSSFTNRELDLRLEEAVFEHERSEQLVCCFLSEVQDRKAYRDFGYDNVYDYACERFGFRERKTRYLISLGRKLKDLPEIREALKTGKLGWCKASRIASVASRQDETLWLDSALSLSVQELDRRIKDGTDRLSSTLCVWLTEEERVVWENALEIARRVSGENITPGRALEYMAAEFIATWGVPPEKEKKAEEPEPEPSSAPAEEAAEPRAVATLTLFPFAESAVYDEHDPRICYQVEKALLEDAKHDYKEVRKFVLDRDHWMCTYPGCNTRRELHVHHLEFRSKGGGHAPSNLTVLCAFHHALLHRAQIRVEGRAPHELEWTPPRLMREVLERKRNRRATWVGELEVREWPGPRASDPTLVPA